jgi:hypothetical protein
VQTSQPSCYLKGGLTAAVPDKCVTSGMCVTVAQHAACALASRLAHVSEASWAMRPYLNGGFVYLAGWLDQSYWPDGLYTAPTEEVCGGGLCAAAAAFSQECALRRCGSTWMP